MAEGLDAVVGKEISGDLKEVNAHLQNIENKSSGPSQSLDGVTEITGGLDEANAHLQSIESSLGEKGGWFHDMLQQIVGHQDTVDSGDKEARDLQSSMIDSLSDMVHFNDVTDKEGKKEKQKKPKGTSAKFDDLKDLPWEIGTLGAVLANTIKGASGDGKEKKSIAGFFKGLMEGVGGIAALGVALFAFAGATLLFNFVNWGAAVVGMLAFTVFTIGMVALAKVVGKNTKDFVRFAEGSLLMSAALGVFAISLWLSSIIFSGKAGKMFGIDIPAIDLVGAGLALLAFGLFTLGLVGLSKIVGENSKNMVDFAKGAILMSAALVTFSIALLISSYIMSGKPVPLPFGLPSLPAIDIGGAIAALVTFGLFISGTAALAAIVGKNNKGFQDFAKGALLMSAALVAFSVSLWISSFVMSGKPIDIPGVGSLPAIDIPGAIAAFVSFGAFVAGFIGLSALANKFGGDLKTFAVTTLLMSASLVCFAIAMGIASNMFSGVATNLTDEDGNKHILPQIDLGGAIAAFVAFGLFVAGFIGLSALANSFAGNLAVFVGVTMLMSVALTMFSFAVGVAALVMTGGEIEAGDQKFSFKIKNPFLGALAMLAEAVIFVAAFAALGVGCIYAGGFVALASAVIIPMSIALFLFSKAVGMASLVMAGGDIDVDGKVYHLEKYDKKNVEGMFAMMSSFIKMFKDIADEIKIKGAIVLGILGKSILPLIEGMDKMIDIVIKAAENKESIDKIISGQGTAIDHLMDPVLYMLLGKDLSGNGGLMAVATGMDKKGAIILGLIASSLGPLIDAMDKMIDVVLKAATMGAEGQDITQLVATANANLDLIMFGPDGTTGFMAMFIKTAEATKNTSKEAAAAMEVMPKVVDALKGLLNIIEESQNLSEEKIGEAIRCFEALGKFLVSFMETVNEIIPGGVGGAISKFFGGDPLKKLEEAHKLLQEGGTYYNIINDLCNIASKFSGQGFENLAKVAVVGTFTADILKSSDRFKDVMENIANGIDKYKNPDKMTTIASSMERIAKVNIGQAFTPLDELMTKAKSLSDTATAIDRIADAMSKLSKSSKSDPFSSAADKLGGIVSNVSGFFSIDVAKTKAEGDVKQAAQPVPKGQELATIAKIMSDWNANGVPVIGPKTPTKDSAIKTLSI